MKFPTIQTGRLLLRKFDETDLPNVFRGLSDPAIIKYYGVSYQTKQAAKEQMKFFKNLEKEQTGIWWAICSLNSEVFYGAGGINGVQKQHRKAEIGFWLFKEFWGKGIIVEAMPLICNYGFQVLGLNRIEGFVETENMNSKKVMAKLGFKYEGTMRDCEIKNGKYISLDIYSKLKDD